MEGYNRKYQETPLGSPANLEAALGRLKSTFLCKILLVSGKPAREEQFSHVWPSCLWSALTLCSARLLLSYSLFVFCCHTFCRALPDALCSSFLFMQAHARQAQQAMPGTYWSNQLSSTSLVGLAQFPMLLQSSSLHLYLICLTHSAVLKLLHCAADVSALWLSGKC